MSTVHVGTVVMDNSGRIGTVSAVEGSRVTITRETGETLVVNTGEYTLQGNTLHLTQQGQASGQIAIPVVEEQLSVGKREVESGGVRVETHVESTPVTENVTLRQEEVTVDRHRVDRPLAAGDIETLRSGPVEVRERSEEAVVNKEARVVEEVVINKQAHQHTETVQDTVRRTDVDVQPLQTSGTATGKVTTDHTTTASGSTTTGHTASGSTSHQAAGGEEEGFLSKAKRAIENTTGVDIDRDGKVG